MITLINQPEMRGVPPVQILLDVSLRDIDTPSHEFREMCKTAKAANRKVGAILRKFDANSYFSYEVANQGQLEIALLAAHAVPKTDVYVNQNCGGSEKW